MSTSTYNLLMQFDGNLTDSSNNGRTVSVDSGTPAYVTGDNGQAFTISSADLSVTVDHPFLYNSFYALNFKIRVATGATDGIIFSVDCGTAGCMQVYLASSQIFVRTANGAQTTSQPTGTTYTADAWQTWSVFNAGAPTLYMISPTGANLNTTNNLQETSWDNADLWPDLDNCTVYFGKAVNTVGISGMQPDTPATGVDIDFFGLDDSNEGRFTAYSVAPPNDLRSEFVPTTPEAALVAPTVIDTVEDRLNAGVIEKGGVIGGGGGGGGGPVIKEFWS